MARKQRLPPSTRATLVGGHSLSAWQNRGPSPPHAHVAGNAVLVVQVKHNDVDFALRLLKKKVQKAGIIRDLRRHRHYEKPSERRRRQKREGIKNTRKREMASLR
jgi:ribosomal protein S21